MRSALTADIRCKQQAAAACRYGSHALQQFVKALLSGKRFFKPGKAMACSQCNTHDIEGILLTVVKEMDFAFQIKILIGLVRENYT
ncbi:hypothetical protein D3C75_1123850 [compost metagenome]